MQKKFIALAIASLAAAPAFAQTHVTMYGIADAYMYNTDGRSTTKTGIDSGGLSGSRLGFRGTEELGGGLKGVFNYEFGTKIDGNSGLSGTRQAYVGVAGGFGTAVLGRLQAPGYYAAGDMDMSGAAWFSPMVAQAQAAGATIISGEPARLNNAVAYISPTWGGFSFTGAYSFGEQNNGSRQGVVGLGAKYAVGGLDVRAVYHGLQNIGGVKTADVNEFFVGASYDFTALKLSASYQRQDVQRSDQDWNQGQLGVSFKVGSAGELYGLVSMSKREKVDSSRSVGFGVGYNHNLSKRTTAYAGFGYLDNDKAVESVSFASDVSGDRVTTVGMGLRHKF